MADWMADWPGFEGVKKGLWLGGRRSMGRGSLGEKGVRPSRILVEGDALLGNIPLKSRIPDVLVAL